MRLSSIAKIFLGLERDLISNFKFSLTTYVVSKEFSQLYLHILKYTITFIDITRSRKRLNLKFSLNFVWSILSEKKSFNSFLILRNIRLCTWIQNLDFIILMFIRREDSQCIRLWNIHLLDLKNSYNIWYLVSIISDKCFHMINALLVKKSLNFKKQYYAFQMDL